MGKHSKPDGSRRSRKSLTARLIQARDRDHRISRDLHDNVGQHLTAIKMSVNALVASPDGDRPRLAKETQDLIDAAIGEVLTGSHWLHPPMLDEFGLAAALRWYVEGFTELSGIHLDLELPADMPRLPNHIETAVFRIAQECLTNLHRHSGSRRGWISIAVIPTRLRLEVKDEGRGIAGQKNRIAKGVSLGVGIPGMRERLRVLGGGLEIRSNEHGTRVVATLPITSAIA